MAHIQQNINSVLILRTNLKRLQFEIFQSVIPFPSITVTQVSLAVNTEFVSENLFFEWTAHRPRLEPLVPHRWNLLSRRCASSFLGDAVTGVGLF